MGNRESLKNEEQHVPSDRASRLLLTGFWKGWIFWFPIPHSRPCRCSNWRDSRGVGRTTPDSMRGAIRSLRNTKPANEGGPASRQAGNISELGISDLRRVTPAILAARISRAIRFRPTEKPSALSRHEHAARHSPRCRLLPRVAGGVGLWAWSSMGEG